MTLPGTRERLLDSAERLLAEKGYAETSLRELTRDAGCNLAAVNYHFGSKEALAHAVIARRFEPINEERVARLDELERRGTPRLEDILAAFLAPVLQRRDDHVVHATRLLLQVSTLDDQLSSESRRLFQKTSERFIPALRDALPEIDAATVFWRISFLVAVVAMSISEAGHLEFISGGRCDPSDDEQALAQMIAFVAAGMRAPSPAPGEFA